MSEQYPVTVAVRRTDGSIEQVRVGTATRTADGFALNLGEMSIGAHPEPRRASAMTTSSTPPPVRSSGAPANFPNYGRSKGAPISGATLTDLEYYANGCRRTLSDPGKSRFHDKERELLAVIEAELARQGHGGEAVPETRRDGGPRWAPPAESEPPPLSDEDIPF